MILLISPLFIIRLFMPYDELLWSVLQTAWRHFATTEIEILVIEADHFLVRGNLAVLQPRVGLACSGTYCDGCDSRYQQVFDGSQKNISGVKRMCYIRHEKWEKVIITGIPCWIITFFWQVPDYFTSRKCRVLLRKKALLNPSKMPAPIATTVRPNKTMAAPYDPVKLTK